MSAGFASWKRCCGEVGSRGGTLRPLIRVLGLRVCRKYRFCLGLALLRVGRDIQLPCTQLPSARQTRAGSELGAWGVKQPFLSLRGRFFFFFPPFQQKSREFKVERSRKFTCGEGNCETEMREVLQSMRDT